MNLNIHGNRLRDLLGLKMAPISIAFRSDAPEGVAPIESSGPSSCSYWRHAAEGNTFYTKPEHHLNCPIGAYTHSVEMPSDTAKELESMMNEMVRLEYIRMEEVPEIPRREEPFGVAIYAPLAESPLTPDVVIVLGNAKQMMLLTEAAMAAKIPSGVTTMGRPTCAMIPASIKSGASVSSLGCIGNRVYTSLQDDELYFAIPGSKIGDVVSSLEVIINANRELETFHRQRAATISQ